MEGSGVWREGWVVLGQTMENDYVMCFVVDESDRRHTDPRRIYSNINEHINESQWFSRASEYFVWFYAQETFWHRYLLINSFIPDVFFLYILIFFLYIS